jgi:hypothetical protein
MDTSQQNSKPFKFILIMVVGILSSGLVCCYLFWITIMGLRAGKIHTLGRGMHKLIIKQNTPGEYWFWIGAHFFAMALVFTVSVLFFISIFRRFRMK